MRKHFLLLFLMALLPLAGWATIEVTTAPTLATGAAYSGVDQSVISADGTATSFGTLTWKYAVTTDGNAPAANATWYTKANMKVKKAGTYYVWYKVESSVSGETATDPKAIAGSFKITKAPLTVKFNGLTTGLDDVVINYGEALPAFNYAVTFEGFVNNEGNTQAKIDAIVKGSLSHNNAAVNANYTSTGTKINGKPDYTISFTGYTADNYSFTYPSVTLKIKQIPLALTPETIPADGKKYFTYSKNAGSLTYNGSAQTATYTIKYYDAQGKVHDLAINVPATTNDNGKRDYTLTYAYKGYAENATYGTAGAAHTNAGFYRPTITAEPTGNYSGNVTIEDEDNNLDFEIAKADVWVYVKEDSKVYDGTAFDDTYAYSKVNYTSLKGLQASEVTGVTIAYVDAADLTAANAKAQVNETGYRMIPVVADNSNLRTNHNVNILNTGRWKITKRPIKVTAKNKTITFGDPVPAFAANDTYLEIEAKGTGKGLINATPGVGEEAAAYNAEKAMIYAALTVGLNGTYTDVNETGYEGAIAVALKTGTDDATVAALAAVSNYDIQPVAGTYIIKGAAYTIVAKPKTITYGDEYTMDDFEYFTNGADVADGQEVAFKLYKNNQEVSMPTDAGEYEIRIVPNEAYLPNGYTLPITYVNETFTIKKKTVTAVLAPQTLMVGDKETALLTSKVKFVEDPNAETLVNGIVGNDVIGFKLGFNVGNEEGQISSDKVLTQDQADAFNASTTNLTNALDWTGSYTAGATPTYNKKFGDDNAMTASDYNQKVNPATPVVTNQTITAEHIAAAKAYNESLDGAKHAGLQAGAVTTTTPYAKGVKIAADNTVAGNKNANYNITWTGTGKLSVLTNTALVLLSDDADLANVNKLAAAGNALNTVIKLDLRVRNASQLPAGTARTWEAKQWNTLVLPFDIEVAELSQAFGYAIVNVVNPDKTTTNNVAFKLYMDKIPANTPFLIKTAKKLVDTTTPANGFTTDGIVKFTAPDGGRTIVAPTEDQMEGVDAGMGYKFVPVYQTKTVDKTQSALRFLLGNYDKWAYITETSENTWDIVPFAAYVDLTAAGSAAHEVTFTMEEADGSTTTVRSIEADGIDNNVSEYAKGWYTINGMKLDAAPAQKGVYILNGKKVVVK